MTRPSAGTACKSGRKGRFLNMQTSLLVSQDAVFVVGLFIQRLIIDQTVPETQHIASRQHGSPEKQGTDSKVLDVL